MDTTDDTGAASPADEPETTVSETAHVDRSELAWSLDDGSDESQRQSWRSVWGIVARIAAYSVVVAGTTGLTLWWLRSHQDVPPPKPSAPPTVSSSIAAPTSTVPPVATVTVQPAPPPVVAAPPLDGTYRLDMDVSKQMHNGQPDPGKTPISAWWGFRSACTSTGCVATGTLLNPENHQAANTLNYYLVLHWIDGRWEGKVTSSCSALVINSTGGAETKHQTVFEKYSLEPQPDGTYGGTLTGTNECYESVSEMPFTASRFGPPPPGIVADPPTMSIPPQPTARR